MAIPTILLADNDVTFVKTTCEYLERNGYRVFTAGDPRSARKIIKKEALALALIDYRLTDDNDDSDESGLMLAGEMIDSTSVPRVIITKFRNQPENIVKSLRQNKEGKSPAMNYIFKQDGLENILKVIQGTLAKKVSIFLSYTHKDQPVVENLYENLIAAGYCPWMDVHNLVPGEKWDLAIRKAIRSADFFIACISKNSITRRGYLQKELKLAVNMWEEKLEGDIFLIPARLDESEIQDEQLKELQRVDLYKAHGQQDLLRAIRSGLGRCAEN